MKSIECVELPSGAVTRPHMYASMRKPTISVLLPCHNERKTAARQVQAIKFQLDPGDEMVMLDDGSTDGTGGVLQLYADSRCRLFRNARPSGVCNAYTFLGNQARCDWVLGASGNDHLQPGAIRSWRFLATLLPQCRVIFGEIARVSRLGWHTRPVFYPDSSMLDLWRKHGGHCTHGAGAFIKREFWGKGYVSSIEWMADWFQTLILACRHGCGYLPNVISNVSYSPHSFSAAHSVKDRYNRAVRGMAEEFQLPEYNDVRQRLTEFHSFTGWLNYR